MRYISTDKVILVIAVITGFIFVQKKDATWLRLSRYLLLISLITEILGGFLAARRINNTTLINSFAIIDFAFFVYFFSEATVHAKSRKWIRSIIFVIPVYFILNMFFVQGFLVFNTYPFIAGCILLVALSVNYFYRIFESDKHYDLLKEPSFWVSVAIIFYFAASVTVTGLFNYISTLPARTIWLTQKILFTVNTLFYILFIIAFLCRKIPRNSSSRS